MSHKLDDITLYYYPTGDVAKQFTMKQNVVSDLYVQYLNAYKPPKTSRISVTLAESDNVRGYFGSSILAVDAQFDKDNFWLLSDKEQNMLILETVHRIALLCAEKYNWDKNIFDTAYYNVIQADFAYKIEGKRKTSRNRQYKAAIQLEKNKEYSTISAVFYDKSDNKIRSVELLKSFQHEMFYGRLIKKNKWFSNNDFGLYTDNEEIVIKASIDKDNSEMIINPKVNSRDKLEEYLRNITFQEFNS